MLVSFLMIPATPNAKTSGRKQVRLTRTEVKTAEARLEALGYRPGRVDGVVDGNTRSALTLFQKWEYRKVTGQLNRDEFDAIINAAAPQARDSGYRHVEVDLDRQLLLLTDDEGVITKLLPISTGDRKSTRLNSSHS